jgi:hypothetical protein
MKLTHPPERVAAVVVGIETYAGGDDWTLHGPGMDALCFARWLCVDRGVPASNVRLFVSLAPATPAAAAEREQVLTALAAKGLKPGEPTQKALIEALHKPAVPGTLGHGGTGGLIVFWSGHGFVDDRTRSRRLFCADADADFGYAIDLSDLASRWRTMPELARLDEQWVIADACAQWLSTLGVTPLVQDAPRPPVLVHQARQYALFATVAGEFARTDASQNVSVFTHAVLDLLPDDGWPDLETLWVALADWFKDSDQSPVAERHDPDGRFAVFGGARGGAYELLSDLKGVKNGWILRAYAQTVFHLPEATLPVSFADAMRLLAALVGSRSTGSFTLIERFLVRLAHICREERRQAAADAIDAWLDEHVVDQPGLTSEREALARPAPRIATLRVWIPPAETPAELHAVLDLGNSTSPAWTPAGKAAATNDSAIAGALRFALAALAAQPRSQRPEELVLELRVPARRLAERLDTLELDITDPDDVFAVDPTVVRLGRDRIVFLRVADRGAANGPKIEWDRAWQQIGERLHRGDIFAVHWIAAIGDASWSAHDFAAFPWIGFTFRAADADPRRFKPLFRALSMGAPFLVWPTEDPVDPAAAAEFQRKVNARLQASSLSTLAGDLVRYRREPGDPAVFSIIVDQPLDGTEPSDLVQPAQKST